MTRTRAQSSSRVCARLSGLVLAALAAMGSTPLQAETVEAPVLSVDAEHHRVTFSATSTDCGLDMFLEFLFVGKGSDHDYEAMFVTDASVTELADAFKRAGIPTGKDFDSKACIFWPVGSPLTLEPAITNLLRDTRGPAIPAIVHTGGLRDEKGVPLAETSSPGALFALYNCGQSLIQFDDSLEQSSSYGRFRPAVKIPKGERRIFTLTWNGKPSCASVTLPLLPGKLAETLVGLKQKAEASAIDVLCDFSPELTLKEAVAYATALSLIDSTRVKINGLKGNQFFYRAYLPEPKWRDRAARLAQPPEVHFAADGSVRVIEIREDWSDPDSLDPKLTVVEHPCKDIAEAASLASTLGAKCFTVFLYAPEGSSLKPLLDFRARVTGPILNWYVFTE